MRKLFPAILLAVVLSTTGLALAATPGEDRGGTETAFETHGLGHSQHGTTAGHLPASDDNVELIGKLELTSAEGRISDVGVWNGFAYLGAFAQPACGGPESLGPDGGVYIVDIADPANPVQVGFIAIHQDSFVGEGVQALEITTPKFTGDLLVVNAEPCGKNQKGGFSLYDVSDPTTPVKLVEHYGDFNNNVVTPGRDANAIHSAFAWDAGSKAYVVVVDDFELTDVDIFDITNPRKPVFIAQYDLDTFIPQIVDPTLFEGDSFLHDMIVKEIGGHQIMLLSYWDGGYVVLDVTDPTNATYVADTDFTFPDPLAAERGLSNRFPEGNGHQAEFTMDNAYIIAADEDFDAYAAAGFNDDDGSLFLTKAGSPAPQLEPNQSVFGESVFVGRACIGDPTVPEGDGTQLALIERGLCTFSEKLANVEAAGGYVAAVVFNRVGADGCGAVFTMFIEGGIPAFMVGRQTGFDILDLGGYDEASCRAGNSPVLPDVGTTGDELTFLMQFDGWGYVHLYENGGGKLTELDTHAIPEAHNPAFATGFGDLSVHEVATSHVEEDLAYLAYYAGGFRVIRIVDDKLIEVGNFIDEGGNNFWGVQVFSHEGTELVAASDRDFGLYIFRFTGD